MAESRTRYILKMVAAAVFTVGVILAVRRVTDNSWLRILILAMVLVFFEAWRRIRPLPRSR